MPEVPDHEIYQHLEDRVHLADPFRQDAWQWHNSSANQPYVSNGVAKFSGHQIKPKKKKYTRHQRKFRRRRAEQRRFVKTGM
jgi:hypothetical protein